VKVEQYGIPLVVTQKDLFRTDLYLYNIIGKPPGKINAGFIISDHLILVKSD